MPFAPTDFDESSADTRTLQIGVEVGSSKAWVEITGLRPEVISELLREDAQSGATMKE